MCTIITIFEHTLSDNHGAVDVLLCSTTITVDTHFLRLFYTSPPVLCMFFFVFLSLSYHSLISRMCLMEQEKAWSNLNTEHCVQTLKDKWQKQYCFCMHLIHINCFILNVFEHLWQHFCSPHHNICHRSSCIFLFIPYFLCLHFLSL